MYCLRVLEPLEDPSDGVLLNTLTLLVLVQGVVSVRKASEDFVLRVNGRKVELHWVDVLEDIGSPGVHENRVVYLVGVC